MYYYSPYFIGYPVNQKNERFSNTDSEERFNRLQTSMGKSWTYNTTNVTYNRNSYGHRSSEISELNLDNYILVTGCSLTEGIAIPEESRYGNLLSNMLNCDVYNLGLGATGNDIIFYNLVSWFGIVKQKPKLVIIQWTGESRYSILNKNSVYVHGPWEDKSQIFLVEGFENKYFESKSIMLGQLIKKIIDVPIIEVFPVNLIKNQGEKSPYKISLTANDFGRDLMHPGIESNKSLAKRIHDLIEQEKIL